MPATEKTAYVMAARKIKEDFVAAHPDARSRGIRKGKRKSDGGARIARNLAPPSLHALALVGSRLNQERQEPDERAESEYSFHSFHSNPPETEHPERYTPSLLDQLCTVAENEHTAAAHMLSALASF